MLISYRLRDTIEHVNVELELLVRRALLNRHAVPRAFPEGHQKWLALRQTLLLVLAVALHAHAVQELVDVLDRERLDAVQHHKLIGDELREWLAIALLLVGLDVGLNLDLVERREQPAAHEHVHRLDVLSVELDLAQGSHTRRWHHAFAIAAITAYLLDRTTSRRPMAHRDQRLPCLAPNISGIVAACAAAAPAAAAAPLGKLALKSLQLDELLGR